jgi:hypothetical protein
MEDFNSYYKINNFVKTGLYELGVVAHNCNPSYSSGGRNWEECSLRPAQAKCLERPHLHK